MRKLSRVAATAVALLFAQNASAVILQSWNPNARIQTGNTTIVDAPDDLPPSGPDDGSGFLIASGDSAPPPYDPQIDAGAESTFALSSGALGAASGFAGLSVPSDSFVYRTFAGAGATYLDELTVESTTLGLGDPVDVRFVFYLSHLGGAQSDLLGFDSVNATAAADIQSTAAGVTHLASANNRFFESTELGLFIQNGIFATGFAEYTISTTVGTTFNFALAADTSAFGALSPILGVGHFAQAASTLGIAFGAEVLAPASLLSASSSGSPAAGPANAVDAWITSGLLGAEFPLASLAGADAAQSAAPTNPFALPEPSTAGLVLLAAIGLVARRSAAGRS